jgi:hypothetical protein
LVSRVNRHNDSTVPDVNHVNDIIDNHDHRSAWTRPLRAHLLAWHHVLGPLVGSLNECQKVLFALPKAFHDGLPRILWELVILHHIIVQVIPEIVGTSCPSVSVENAKEADLRPLNIQLFLALRLQNIQDDAHPVLVVFSDDALVSVGCVRFDHSTFLLTRFRRLMVF